MMTLYLSNHWRINKVLNYLLILCFFAIFAYIYNINSSMSVVDSVILFIATVVVPAILLFYIQKKAVQPIMKKIIISENEIVMISSHKKRTVIDTNKKVYYEKLRLMVGMYNSQDFIVLSNTPFKTLKNFDGLSALCKFSDKAEKFVIAPYNEKTIQFFETCKWIESYKTDRQGID